MKNDPHHTSFLFLIACFTLVVGCSTEHFVEDTNNRTETDSNLVAKPSTNGSCDVGVDYHYTYVYNYTSNVSSQYLACSCPAGYVLEDINHHNVAHCIHENESIKMIIEIHDDIVENATQEMLFENIGIFLPGHAKIGYDQPELINIPNKGNVKVLIHMSTFFIATQNETYVNLDPSLFEKGVGYCIPNHHDYVAINEGCVDVSIYTFVNAESAALYYGSVQKEPRVNMVLLAGWTVVKISNSSPVGYLKDEGYRRIADEYRRLFIERGLHIQTK